MKTHNYSQTLPLLLIMLLFSLGACNKKLELPSGGERKIVLLGELVAEDTVRFRGGQSTPLVKGAKADFTPIRDLSVVIDEGGTTTTITGYEDDMASSLATLAFTSQRTIKPGAVCSVTARHPEMKEATASVRIPEAFTTSIADTSRKWYNGEACIHLRVLIADAPTPGQHYVIEALQVPYINQPTFLFNGEWLRIADHTDIYDSLITVGEVPQMGSEPEPLGFRSRIEFFTSDVMSERYASGSGNLLGKRVLLDDKRFNGNAHICDIYIPESKLVFPVSGIESGTLIQVKSVGVDYYEYLKAYEDYDPSYGFNNTLYPIRLPGNIVNGVGMLGGVFRREFLINFN